MPRRGRRPHETQGIQPFRTFLLGIPDAIARSAERGMPITAPDPGTDHGRALYRTLGVVIERPELPDLVKDALPTGAAMRALTPLERRGLKVLLREELVRSGRLDERLNRERNPSTPHRYVSAPAKIVYADESGSTHVAFVGATRTLCLELVLRGVRGRGQHAEPKCFMCRRSLEQLRERGLVRIGKQLVDDLDRCRAVTRKGSPCEREPLPGLGYCPSHKHLAKVGDRAAGELRLRKTA